MHIFSFSDVLMTIITSNVLIIICTLFLRNTKLLIQVGYRILAIIISFIILRMVFTLEFSFAHNIILPEWISRIVVFIKHPEALGSFVLSPWNFFQGIWLIGFIYFGSRYIYSYQCAKKWIISCGKDLYKTNSIYNVLDEICKEAKKKNRFIVKEIQGIESPMLFGIFSPYILLPVSHSWTPIEMDIILRHEASHYFHRDLLLKAIVKIITIVYWWNPFCHMLNHQADIIMDIRIDDKIISNGLYSKKQYMNCLLSIAQTKGSSKELSPKLTVSFCRNESLLTKRFLMLTPDRRSSTPLQGVLLLASLGIIIVSYLFIFEALYVSQSVKIESIGFGNEGDYVIQGEDGTFSVYLNNQLIDTTDSLKYYEAYDFIIYNEKGEIMNEK